MVFRCFIEVSKNFPCYYVILHCLIYMESDLCSIKLYKTGVHLDWDVLDKSYDNCD